MEISAVVTDRFRWRDHLMIDGELPRDGAFLPRGLAPPLRAHVFRGRANKDQHNEPCRLSQAPPTLEIGRSRSERLRGRREDPGGRSRAISIGTRS